ncbi:MAG: cobyrinate a,c-diamide synthase [Gemmatimonadales bacterium]
MSVPRIVVAGLRGGSGKTLVSLGLVGAWRRKQMIVAPFKKGPDYIDAAWLSQAAGRPCRNLDLYLMSPDAAHRSFVGAVEQADVAVIEGNRGLFDGMDAHGTYSTAELAKILAAPVVLIVDCTKATRTTAALVLGCLRMDPEVPIRGVILNQTGGPRHRAIVQESIEQICDVPVLGAIPRLPMGKVFPERHLGLVPPQEHEEMSAPVAAAAQAIEEHVDLDAVWEMARGAPGVPGPQRVLTEAAVAAPARRPNVEHPRIGVFRDAAFQFYYPENLEALEDAGAVVTEVSPIDAPRVPEVDALYIGGGFPETLAPDLAANTSFREQLRREIERGLPVYAECGGAVFLGETLVMQGMEYPMVGVLPVTFGFGGKPQGHGYVEVEAIEENPFYDLGLRLRGHEFHYTYLQSSGSPKITPKTRLSRAVAPPKDVRFAFRVHNGFGFDGDRDGLCWGQVLASYTHVHALGVPQWAPAMVRQARQFRSRR